MESSNLQNSPVWNMLSEYGKRVKFLKNGVLGQTWKARQDAYAFNATLGELKEQGKDVVLESLHRNLAFFAPEDVYPYAKPGGIPELRKAWQEKILRENSELNGKRISTPLVCAGLTHGLSLVAEMFLNPGDPVILHDMHWENYELIFETRSQGKMVLYPTFFGNSFNVQKMKEAILEEPAQKQLVILNFPNNPTGYMPGEKEVEQIRNALISCAEAGKQLVVLCDDAYYGFWYGEKILRESLFGHLTDIHPNILTIRLDGATKEFFCGGLRIGFLTFGGQPMEFLSEIEQKMMGAIRISVSSCSHLSQTILLECLQSKEIQMELHGKKKKLAQRGNLAIRLCEQGSPQKRWKAYPFKAGYFICLDVQTDAQKLKDYLLMKHGIGVIALDHHRIRIALPCLEENELCQLFGLLDSAIAVCQGEAERKSGTV